MKEIRIPLDQFDLAALLDRTLHFLKEQVSPKVNPTYAIVWVERPGGVPVFGPETGWDVLSALSQEGKIVFFPFAYTDADGTLTCADGNTYGPPSDNEDSAEELFIGLEDAVGYLVQVQDGAVIINSAIHTGGGCPGPAPRVGLRSSCGILDGPMDKFIRGFIRG
jgi:hypothetical protein